MKFYPPSKTLQAKNSIAQFRQRVNGELPQAWERFCNLLITCPHHGFPQEQITSFFYCGLTDQERLHLDACSGGTYWLKSAEEIAHIIDGIMSNSFQMKMDRSNHHRVAQVEESDAMKTMIMILMEKFDAFSGSMPRETLPPLVHDQQGVQEVNFMSRQNFQGGNYNHGKQSFQSQPQGQFPKIHKEGTMLLQTFKAAVQFPPGFNPGAKLSTHEGKPINEDALAMILKKMEGMEAQVTQMGQQFTQINQQQKTMEFQMGQLATIVGNMQNKGKFPSTTEPNPKEHCKAIELRSGTMYQGPSLPSEENVEEKATEIEQEAEDDKVSEIEEDEEIEPNQEDEEEKGQGS
ncbi:hypothetical protein ACS0TY_031229 [Phlomoides rotata]